MLTLFGLVLAIGIVVDDAIVVIENVERIMATEGLPPRLAADKAIRQVAGALIAIVLVLCAVFVPVAFIGGVTGAMFKQFAMTIVDRGGALGHRGADAHAGALRAPAQGAATRRTPTGFFGWFNRGFARVTRALRRASAARWPGRRAWLAAFAVLLVLAGVALAADADGVHPDRGQGLLRHGDAAARRCVAAAHRGRGPAASRDSSARSRRCRTSWRLPGSTC